MHQGKFASSQLKAYLPMSTLRRCRAKHRHDHKVKDFSCRDRFFAMAFAQLLGIYLDAAVDAFDASAIDLFLSLHAHRT
jgi:hypothetical protein